MTTATTISYSSLDTFFTKWTTAQEVVKKINLNGHGRTAIVTGSNSGIGYESALSLILSGFNVICCCRSLEKSTATVESIHAAAAAAAATAAADTNVAAAAHNIGTCSTGIVDLGDLNSVRSFVDSLPDDILISILLNNAGIMQLPSFQTSEQGYEKQFAVNFLGPWLLTRLMTPKLQQAATTTGVKSRVVNVASSAHYASSLSKIPTADMIGDPVTARAAYTNGWNEYATSKLYQILDAKHHAKKKNSGSGSGSILFFSLHPGVIKTGLARNSKCCSFTRLLYCFPKSLYCCCCCCQGVLRTSVQQGAATSVRACIDPSLEASNGCYLHENTHPKEPRLPENFDSERFQERCEELCGGGGGDGGDGGGGGATGESKA